MEWLLVNAIINEPKANNTDILENIDCVYFAFTNILKIINTNKNNNKVISKSIYSIHT